MLALDSCDLRGQVVVFSSLGCDYLNKLNTFWILHLVQCLLDRELGVACEKGDLCLLGNRCNGDHRSSYFAKFVAAGGRCCKSGCRSVKREFFNTFRFNL